MRSPAEGLLYPFLADPAPELLERHRRHGTAHAALIAEILNMLAGRSGGYGGRTAPPYREVIGGSPPGD